LRRYKTKQWHAGLVFAAAPIDLLQPAFAKTAINFLSHKDHAGIYDKNPHKNAAIFYKKPDIIGIRFAD
jgi:hypothetical protein